MNVLTPDEWLALRTSLVVGVRAVVVALPVTSCAVAETVKPHASRRPAPMRTLLMEWNAMLSSC
jgi:hypothetical protein